MKVKDKKEYLAYLWEGWETKNGIYSAKNLGIVVNQQDTDTGILDDIIIFPNKTYIILKDNEYEVCNKEEFKRKYEIIND
jgi:hypothetical protein